MSDAVVVILVRPQLQHLLDFSASLRESVMCVSIVCVRLDSATSCGLVGLCAGSHQIFCSLLNVAARSATIPVCGGCICEAAIEERLPIVHATQ